MSLDLNTTIVINLLINYVCTYIIGATWHKTKNKFKGIELVLADFILQSIGMTLVIFTGVLPDFMTIILANICMYFGAMLLVFGIAKFVGVTVLKWPYIFAMALFSGLYIYFTFITASTRMRLIVFTTMVIPIFLHTAYIVFFKTQKHQRAYTYPVAISNVLFTLAHGSRLINDLHDFDLFNYAALSQGESAMVIINELLMIYLTFSITQMIHIRLLNELDKYIGRTEKLLHKTRHLAITDDLTQLYNRRKIEALLGQEIEKFHTYKSPFSILMIDIDHFKRFNDTYGHDIGDKVLQDVARTLETSLRSTDIVGRWGGEEFLVILSNTSSETACEVGNKLLQSAQSLDLPYCLQKEILTLSIGCANMSDHLSDNDLIKQADTALYHAKENGRNQIIGVS